LVSTHYSSPAGVTPQILKQVDNFVASFFGLSRVIVFGIRNSRSPNLHFLIGEQAKIMHYMAKHPASIFLCLPQTTKKHWAILALHFRYELGFIPPAIDGKRHQVRVC
jgi:hypothetical protein